MHFRFRSPTQSQLCKITLCSWLVNWTKYSALVRTMTNWQECLNISLHINLQVLRNQSDNSCCPVLTFLFVTCCSNNVPFVCPPVSFTWEWNKIIWLLEAKMFDSWSHTNFPVNVSPSWHWHAMLQCCNVEVILHWIKMQLVMMKSWPF